MSALDQVKQMKQQGIPQDQIVQTLRDQKVPYKEISDALAHSEIKAAVEEQPSAAPQTLQAQSTQELQAPPMEDLNSARTIMPQTPVQNTPATMPSQQTQAPSQNTGMQASPSIQESNTFQQPGLQAPMPSDAQPQMPSAMSQDVFSQQGYDSYPQDAYGQDSYSQGYDQGYDYQDYGNGGFSSDTIAEIAEQVISERISDMRKPIEKVIDFKTTAETRMDSIDERLKRIEKTIHTLQSSVLGKVGEYITNISDIKQELIETQKSFAKIHSHTKTSSTRKKTTKHKTSKK